MATFDEQMDALADAIGEEMRLYFDERAAALRAELMHRIGAVESGLASSLDATLAATEKALEQWSASGPR